MKITVTEFVIVIENM